MEEKKFQILESNGEWVDTHELMYSRFPEDKRRILPTPAASTPGPGGDKPIYQIGYYKHPDEPMTWVNCSKEEYAECNKVGGDTRIAPGDKGGEEAAGKDFGNPIRNLVGQNNTAKPPDKKILENILNGMSEFGGTCWCPVHTQTDGIATSFSLMLNQCPKACGDVWRITIADKDVANWLVNEINNRRHSPPNQLKQPLDTLEAAAEKYSKEHGKISEVNGYPVFAFSELAEAVKFGARWQQSLTTQFEIIAFKDLDGVHWRDGAGYFLGMGLTETDMLKEGAAIYAVRINGEVFTSNRTLS